MKLMSDLLEELTVLLTIIWLRKTETVSK